MVSFSVRKDEPIAEGAEEGRRGAEGEEGVEEREREPLVAGEREGRVEAEAPTAAEDRGTSPFGEDWERGGLLVRMGFLAMESV